MTDPGNDNRGDTDFAAGASVEAPPTYGAGIHCSGCHAMAYPPAGSGFRQSFDLRRVASGEWSCELCRPATARAYRPPRTATLSETLIDIEERLREALAVLEVEVDGSDFDANYANREAVQAFRAELERGLEALRKAIAAHEPKPAAPRPKKGSPYTRRAGQGELLAPKAAPAPAAADEGKAAS